MHFTVQECLGFQNRPLAFSAWSARAPNFSLQTPYLARQKSLRTDIHAGARLEPDPLSETRNRSVVRDE
ncbi:hypothetical protein L596_024759 [Steinernema carpocapsae]|uniref:Uncharacterized protein n=1 Tax=Steinernema carpocapsae TaxID=34508 RepID=A0A4U5M5N7_STECR|nr:hypothetical protein L596_024759 [Steinernema carpocapsae]